MVSHGGRPDRVLELVSPQQCWQDTGGAPMDTSFDTSVTETPSPTASRITAPVVRATIAIGTIVALVASVGAPYKWY
jgi:hypothetical protein